jgi:cytochrome o ubiquinol oxidase subunit 2
MSICRRFLPCLGACLVLAVPRLGSCSVELLSPQGPIGGQERTLILVSLGLMLTVVIPVILLTLWFAWRYRAGNRSAPYAPTWAHSTRIEMVVWTVPCIIVAILSVLIWRTTHSLDPYRPLDSAVKPLRVEVVALDWKWLFIYPDYGVASVNQLAMPVGTPVDFRLTAASVMNSFFIPQLGTQIYAMAGMQTQLHLIAAHPGVYHGLSAAFSGPGFSDMHFDALVTDRGQFEEWVRWAHHSGLTLDSASYEELAKPSVKNAVTLYAQVKPGLFDQVVGRYMPANGHDMHDMPGMTGMTVPAPAGAAGE